MRKSQRIFILAGGLLMLSLSAVAQSPPSYVRPNPGGGYTVTTPGQPPTYVRPNPGGGYTVTTPGSPPTYIRENPGGEYTVTRP